jgi:hypothetical protein
MFKSGFMKNALLALLMLTPLLGLLGTMAVNKKMAFFSDALGHSALAGVGLGLLLGIRNETVSLLVFGILWALLISRINQKGKTVCVIAKLKNRIDGHRATIGEDFQVLKDVVLNKRREEKIHQWVVEKIKGVYTRLNDNYKDCKFEYEGWVK